MATLTPPNAKEIGDVIEERLAAAERTPGVPETAAAEWRGAQRYFPVISVPVGLLYYNPGTHRIRAQRSLKPALERKLDEDPFGDDAQGYLHDLLMSDPKKPTSRDAAFDSLKEDIRLHGQDQPGLITRTGIIINGNTRRAALKELGKTHIRVGVLPPDVSGDDIQSVELSLQLRKDHRRDYSFMNLLLAVDERVAAGRPAATIQADFRMKATTFERCRWILELVREAIERSSNVAGDGRECSLRLVDFEEHQGKLEELYRAYMALKATSPDDAEALREQRLLALVLGKSKTDLRFIESDFSTKYMRDLIAGPLPPPSPGIRIPGLDVHVSSASSRVEALREKVTAVLKAKAVDRQVMDATPESAAAASATLKAVMDQLESGLDAAGKTERLLKKRVAPAVRIGDATDILDLVLQALAEARTAGSLDLGELDEALIGLKVSMAKLAAYATRGIDAENSTELEGVAWLLAIRALAEDRG